MLESIIKSEGINSDAYIFIPCYFNPSVSFTSQKKSGDGKDMIDYLADIYSVEFTKDIAFNIERTYLESVEIKVSKYMEDAITRSFMADLYLSYQKITNIGVVMVVIPNNETELTNIFDQVSRDRLEVNVNAEIKLLNSYLKEKYGIIKCGVSRTYTSLSQKPSFEYMQYLISNEVYKSDLTENASLCSDEIREAATRNIAQYDFGEFYVYKTSLVQIEKKQKLTYDERKFNQCLSVFLVEFLQYQEASLSRINTKVYNELHNYKRYSIKKIQEINLEFSRSIKFWDTNVFVYPVTQNLIDKISNAFGIYRKLNEFNNNKDFLEHLIMTDSIISNEKESKILNYTLLLLTITQVIPIYFELYNYIVNGADINIDFKYLWGLFAILLIIVVVKINNNLKKRSFLKMKK